jgi:hypothetical protein
MLNFGIIEEHSGTLKVRVLINNGDGDQIGSTKTKDLPVPIIDSRLKNGYKAGDTVVVGYVYDDTSRPCVLFPYGDKRPTPAEREEKAIKVLDTATLPIKTEIGDVKDSEIQNLKGLNFLLIEKIRQMEDAINDLKKSIARLL